MAPQKAGRPPPVPFPSTCRTATRQATGAKPGNELTLAALDMAIKRRRPLPGLMHHSDRGSQYAADAYQKRLTEHAIVCSMSRKGNCWEPVRVSEANPDYA